MSVKSFDIVVIGLGGVGQALVRQLHSTFDRLKRERGIGLRMIGLADRSGLLHCDEGLSAETIEEALEAKLQGNSLEDIQTTMPPTRSLAELASPGVLFVDATAAPGMATVWRDAVDAGAGVVLANKLPLCETWRESAALFNHPRVRYEATVGAGLPILSTLRSLVGTGDVVDRIEGALSGTLGFLSERLSNGALFSEALAEAIILGYVEPDPSEDLSGRDVARKAVILSRTVGLPVEMDDIDLEGLVSDSQVTEMKKGSIGASIDDGLKRRFQEASRGGNVLRYLACVSPDGIRVGLTSIPASDPFAAISGPENRVTFYTRRYSTYPLAIAGPGAGLEVTAAGVLSDLIDLAEKQCTCRELS